MCVVSVFKMGALFGCVSLCSVVEDMVMGFKRLKFQKRHGKNDTL